MSIENNVVKLQCGGESGNAVVLNSNTAVTVKHCVNNYFEKQDKIILYDSNGQELVATVIGNDADCFQNEQYVFLNFEPKLNVGTVSLVTHFPRTFEKAAVFGFDKNHCEAPIWHKIEYIGSRERVAYDAIYDLIYNDDTKEKSVAGLSGSPIVFLESRNFVYGLISQERLEAGEQINIEGISVASQKEYIRLQGISVEEINNRSTIDADKKTIGYDYSVRSKEILDPCVVESQGPLFEYKLEEITSLALCGKMQEALERLRKEINQICNRSVPVSNEVKAKYQYQYALWLSNIPGKNKVADRALEKAKMYDPSLDIRSYLAIKAAHENNNNYISLLKPIESIQILNVCIQCYIYDNKFSEAINIYEEYCDELMADENTYYLVSNAYLALANFAKSLEYIQKAISLNTESARYYLQRGLIRYWSCMPKGTWREGNIYPLYYTNSIFMFTEEEKKQVLDAVDDFRLAYGFVNNGKNTNMLQQVLGIWIAVLSVSPNLASLKNEPTEILKTVNQYHLAVLLGRDLVNEQLFVHDIKAIKDMIGSESIVSLEYIRILADAYLQSGQETNAKSLLFEYKELFSKFERMDYWYELVDQFLTDEQREHYIDEIKNDNITEINKERLLCLYTKDMDTIFGKLVSVYESTNDILDLMNVLWFCKNHNMWSEEVEYSDCLLRNHENLVGYVYKVHGLINAKSYSMALEVIDEAEKYSISELSNELYQYKMNALIGEGKLTEALSVGREMYKVYPTEEMAHELANISLGLGDKIGAIHFLTDYEVSNKMSTHGYQRLSTLYMTVDKERSFSYAKILSEGDYSPQVKLWAAQQMSLLGKSDEMEAILEKTLQSAEKIEGVQMLNFEEISHLLSKNYEKNNHLQEEFMKAQLPIHVLMDGLNATMCHCFYNSVEKSLPLFSCFGAHSYKVMNDNKVIVLDITSCLTLCYLEMLNTVSEHMKIVLPETFFPLLLEEQNKLVPSQEDIHNKRKKVFDLCVNELNIKVVEPKIPENISDIAAIKRGEVISKCTAELYSAKSVASKEEGTGDYTPTQIADICQKRESDWNGEKQRILVSILHLEEWYDQDILYDVAECFDILIKANEAEVVAGDMEQIENQKQHNEKINVMLGSFRDLVSKGRITFFHSEDQKGGYSELLTAEMGYAIDNNAIICIDDRWVQSYSTVEKMHIISSMDLVRYMYKNGWIKKTQYYSVWKKIIKQRMLFLLPDSDYIQHCLCGLTKEVTYWKEDTKLLELRAYINFSFLKLREYGNERLPHMLITENSGFLLQYEQISRNLIEEIWDNKTDSFENKCAKSNWVLSNIMQYGMPTENANPDFLSVINVSQLILQGIMLKIRSKDNSDYIKWLFSTFAPVFEENMDFFKDVVGYVEKFILSFILKDSYEDNLQYKKVYEILVAQGIHSLPERMLDELLLNDQISEIHNKVYKKIVQLSEIIYFDEAEWNTLLGKILALSSQENMAINKNNIEIMVSWSYVQPFVPGVHFEWTENGKECKRCLYGLAFARLLHERQEIRTKEYMEIVKSLNMEPDESVIQNLRSSMCYFNEADRIKRIVLKSSKYIHQTIKDAIINGIIFTDGFEKYCIPTSLDFFKEMYNVNRDGIIISDVEGMEMFPGHSSEVETLNHNPVRVLNNLLYVVEEKHNKIYDELDRILSYLVDDKEAVWGKLYITLLSIIKDDLQYLFKDEEEVNIIVWTYIWVDEIMSAIVELCNDGLELNSLIEKLKKSNKAYFLQDTIGTECEEYMDPQALSLYRLAYVWPLKILMDFGEEEYRKEIDKIYSVADKYAKDWFTDIRNAREVLVSFSDCTNIFESRLYVEDSQELVSNLAMHSQCDTVADIHTYKDMIINKLQMILEKSSLDKNDQKYLSMISLKKIEPRAVELIESIILKIYVNSDSIKTLEEYRVLYPFLGVISEEVLNTYRDDTFEKLKIKLLSNQASWEKVLQVGVYLVTRDNMDAFLDFLDDYASKIKEPVENSLIQVCLQMQLELPKEYSQRLYEIRNKFAAVK